MSFLFSFNLELLVRLVGETSFRCFISLLIIGFFNAIKHQDGGNCVRRVCVDEGSLVALLLFFAKINGALYFYDENDAKLLAFSLYFV